ncbi:hypothetical protein [Butyrivibrio sp. INlla16]|uniref:hypothetical protein n=1 Tax=Butyrivibrio sp. INlla16 TaxID=1520807 RepID=UPI00087E5E2D|nr:hypothetical protein [Butyrivibrio sp. INlla16]SDB07603.1 hypothetical protein SAMN02910263_00311 [Butyrivibrio sp. INlla16]
MAVNAHWEDHDFELPILPEGYKWELVLESGGYGYDGSGRICLKSRSTAILKAN